MTPAELGESLLRAASFDERENLLTQAESEPDVVRWLLARAVQVLPTAPDETETAAELAGDLARRQGDARTAALAGRAQAQALRALGRHEAALRAFDAAAESAQQAGDAKLAAQVQIGRIDSLGWLGRHEEAAVFAPRLIAILRREGAEEDAAKVLVNLGNVHYRRDRFQEALRCYEEASATLTQVGDAVAVARLDFNRANILSEQHQAEEALRLFRQVRAVFAANEMMPQVAMTDFNIGVLHHRSGEYAAALVAQQRARQEFAERGQTLEAAKCDADMADLYRALNLRVEAVTCYARAIAVFETIPLDYERGRAELGRAATLAAQGNTEEAGAALSRAEVVFRQHRNAVQGAQARLLRAYWRRGQNDTEGAEAEARSAARVFAQHRLFARAAEARFLAADIALHAGQSATRRMASVGRAARQYGQGWLECRAEQSLGQYRARRGETRRALDHLRAAVRALEAARTLVPGEDLHTAFVSDKLSVYEDLVGLLLTRGRSEDMAEALEYVEQAKSRLLLERVQASLAGMENAEAEGGTDAQRTRLSLLRAQLNRLYNQMQPTEGEGGPRLLAAPWADADTLTAVEEAYRVALQAVELEATTGVFTLSQSATTAQLQAWLGPEETLVEYYVVHGEVCAFVLAGERVTVHRGLTTTHEIELLARRLRYHLHRAGSASEYVEGHAGQLLTSVLKPLAHLYDLLLRPLESRLSQERVALVPHGSLHGLPFHAFYDGAQYALDRWEFVCAPSATLRFAGRLRAAHGKNSSGSEPTALVMGVPDAGLEQVAVEVESLAKTLPQAQVFCGESATLSAFRAHAERSRLIHLATHALFRTDNPLFSGLRFSDGWLLARDLYTMRLRCDLVTLSACRTGQARIEAGDELFGLLRGFLAAGAGAIAVSLWPADDAATATLMMRFYALRMQGLSCAAALRAAQQELRAQSPHPYRWAAFALFGER